MTRRRSVALAACAVSAALALGACTGTPGAAPPSPSGTAATTTSAPAAGASADATAWAERVCTVVAGEVPDLTTTPPIDPSDLVAAKESLVTFLGQLSASMGELATGVRGVGAPPVEGGGPLFEQALDDLAKARESIDAAKTTVGKVDATDPAAFQAGFLQLTEDLQRLGEVQDPIKVLRDNPELSAAFASAPACADLAPDPTSSAPTS